MRNVRRAEKHSSERRPPEQLLAVPSLLPLSGTRNLGQEIRPANILTQPKELSILIEFEPLLKENIVLERGLFGSGQIETVRSRSIKGEATLGII